MNDQTLPEPAPADTGLLLEHATRVDVTDPDAPEVLDWSRAERGRFYRLAQTQASKRDFDARLMQSIADRATDAVRVYKSISGIENDNELPEIFLGSHTARAVVEDLRVHAQVELPYTTMARDQHVSCPPGIEGWRSDLAIYIDGKPYAAVEFKKYDDRKLPESVVRDGDKLHRLRGITRPILCILITDVRNGQQVWQRRAELESALGISFSAEGPLVSSGNDWNWQIVCGTL